MGDNWDDDDDEWDVDDDALDAKLGINKNKFDDEEDLALKEKAAADKATEDALKKKGSAMAAKKKAEKERKEEEELARKQMEYEAKLEENMTPDERRTMERKRIEAADNDLTDDLFGAVDKLSVKEKAQQTTNALVMTDMKSYLKHARKVADCMNANGKTHLTAMFLNEVISQCKNTMDDDAISEILKTCNQIKNEKLLQSKRKTKGQAQKSKKADKAAQAKAKKVANETFGDSNDYDVYDEIGDGYQDDCFF